MVRALRAQLHHFDHSPDFGDAESVEAIRRLLLLRIRQAEGAMRCPVWLLPETETKREQYLHSEAA